ncbi:hypothetical protein F5888DRAFT_1797912 [Russula emetica]|nr:hypothetical protein F5888DRAFT_1797912 [Russula emetica]
MTSISHSHPSDDHPRSQKSLLASTWQVLDQPPPPTLREILGAYRSRGDGDREMLMAMLNAKSAEDQRIASVASLHRSMLEYYQMFSRQAQEIPCPSASDSQGPSHHSGAYQSSGSNAVPTSHCPYNHSDMPSQHTARIYSHKRTRTSASPPSTYRSVPSSYTPSPPPGQSSPYSLGSASVDQSPRSKDAMAIGSLLSMDPRNPRDEVDDALQNELMREDRSQLCRQ